MNPEEKLKILKECSDFSSEEKLLRFDNTLATLDKNKDFSIFPELFTFFSDDCYDDCVMFSLIAVLESLDDKIYIHLLLENINKVFGKSKDWAKILILSIINKKDVANLLKNNLSLVDKDILLKVFNLILSDKFSDDKQKQAVAQLKDQINKKN